MKIFWITLSFVAIVVAGALLWRGDFDKAFIAAALGAVSWFLNYRVQLKAVVTAADLEDNKRHDVQVDEEFDDE